MRAGEYESSEAMKNTQGRTALRILSNTAGFTLSEILVAVTILMIGFMGVQSLGVGVVRGNLMSDRMTAASTLAQDKLESIRRLGYSAIAAGTTTEAYGTIPLYSFFRRVTIVESGVPSAGMKKITVTAYWSGDARSVTLSSFIAE